MHGAITITAKYAIVLPPFALLYQWLKLTGKRRLEMITLGILSGLLTIGFVKLATTLHQDPRPFVRDGIHPYFASSTDNGFPSDHTAVSALAGFIALRYSRKIGIGLLVLSLLIGTARVISGVHHAQDIIAGFVIAGASVGIALVLIKLSRRWR